MPAAAPSPTVVSRGSKIEIELGAEGRGVGRLGPFRAWAVAFAPLGTSVYYVPGLLYGQVGAWAPAFVLAAAFAFVLVAVEHAEIAHRFPGGGGCVAAASAAFGNRAGAVSGALMVSAYLLTMVISVVTALDHVAALGRFPYEVGVLSVGTVLALGFLNWIGLRPLARVTLITSVITLVVDVVLTASLVAREGLEPFVQLLRQVRHLPSLGLRELIVGFAGAWLAYSGMESLGQIAPALARPRRRTVRLATALIIASVLITAPLFTALAVRSAASSGGAPPNALLVPVAMELGGPWLRLALVLPAATLLLLAANFSFIGCYSVFQAIGELGYLPAVLARRHPKTGTPHGAVVAITLGALTLLAVTRANLPTLGYLFAFGLLGSYAITSLSIDVLRWREGKRGAMFALGLGASFTLVLPWMAGWVARWQATLYGMAAAGIMLFIGLVTHRGWIRAGRFGFVRATSAEEAAALQPGSGDVVTLAEAVSLKEAYPSTTLVALRAVNPALCREAARRAKGAGDAAVVLAFVDEVPGLLFPSSTGPSTEARRVLVASATNLREQGIEAIPLWRVAHDPGAAIAEAAEALGTHCVLVGTTQRSAVWHFLRGSVLKRLITELPESVRVVICE